MNSRLSLHTRISLVLTLLAATLLLVLAAVWLHGAKTVIHEEIEAASRVSEQWLKALAGEWRMVPADRLTSRVLDVVRPLGRVRANELRVETAAGAVLYRSPPPKYKAGRTVPSWFSALLAQDFEPRAVLAGDVRLVLQPDASRSIIDAWDDLLAMAGWAGALLILLFVASRWALGLALRPLDQVMAGLDRMGYGRFDTRLPLFATPELGRLSLAFNGMADRLAAAVDENVRLETEREVADRMQRELEGERRGIARELHDELAQGMTAVRSLAGAIVQRTYEQPAVLGMAQSIVAVSGEMQSGIRAILHRLSPLAGRSLETTLGHLVTAWRSQHQGIDLCVSFDLGKAPLADEVARTVVRVVQEGLTNVVRHAAATRVDLTVTRGLLLDIRLADNGCGWAGQASAFGGSGLGLAGMRERVTLLGGDLEFHHPAEGGFCLHATLPATQILETTHE